jgi:hypothetical protein
VGPRATPERCQAPISGEPYPEPARKLNPLPVDLAWVRGMDFLSVLTDMAAIEGSVAELAERRGRLPR